jgi:hypothetical protein
VLHRQCHVVIAARQAMTTTGFSKPRRTIDGHHPIERGQIWLST